ncbi:hypothetical protein AcV7_001583 [Taiwanofungus camphoratus]|nr:hypothetical protein AcV7_001583 [Antrodia cinnamomea]
MKSSGWTRDGFLQRYPKLSQIRCPSLPQIKLYLQVGIKCHDMDDLYYDRFDGTLARAAFANMRKLAFRFGSLIISDENRLRCLRRETCQSLVSPSTRGGMIQFEKGIQKLVPCALPGD